MTGKLTAPQIETGAADTNYFQSRKFRGEGDASTYYHAIDFGYANHDQVDFYEYGGLWNFYKNMNEEGFRNAMRFLEEPIKSAGREKYHIFTETKYVIPSNKLYSQMIIPRNLDYFYLKFFSRAESKLYSRDFNEKKEFWDKQVSMYLEGVDMKKLESDTFNTLIDTLTKDPWILKRVRGTKMYNTRDDMLILALLMTVYNYDSLI